MEPRTFLGPIGARRQKTPIVLAHWIIGEALLLGCDLSDSPDDWNVHVGGPTRTNAKASFRKSTGVQWGDLGMDKNFRHAGLAADEVEKIVPNEIYV
ncbi:hypothetical protein K504DRAFT_498718 [Pleomassaria siparia CBS 279.74]|uniref:Uncharacterized protein n=1 Tax=Pleomassaria siparia CBS 279.74 TaxID=1314801 RepID=A0A6G1KMQ9_9PLEO|nr:hypothetical protein K504DRAFT_498718 [Pleomassaria siparia CBS 279.74]